MQAVAVDIQLVNPLDDVVVFEVALTGDGLLGEASVTWGCWEKAGAFDE